MRFPLVQAKLASLRCQDSFRTLVVVALAAFCLFLAAASARSAPPQTPPPPQFPSLPQPPAVTPAQFVTEYVQVCDGGRCRLVAAQRPVQAQVNPSFFNGVQSYQGQCPCPSAGVCGQSGCYGGNCGSCGVAAAATCGSSCSGQSRRFGWRFRR